ncbi:MAG TPA: AMP-binding protein [Vineibacter sp.]|nr:AMP-binding protein [Vineibacter sp.]
MDATAPFRNAADIAAFASTPLQDRLGGDDLIAMILRRAATAPDAPAIEYLASGVAGSAGVTVSRRALCDGAAVLAVDLRAMDIGSDDVVASLLPNGPGTVAAALAAMAVATLAPINLYLEATQIGMLISECRARLVLLPRDPPPAIAGVFAAIRDHLPAGTRCLDIDTAAVPAANAAAPPLTTRAHHDRVGLFHTGGTTGLPKFVPLSALNIAAGALISGFGYGYRTGDRVICGMPMFHVGGLLACTLYPLASGVTVIMLGPLGYRGPGVVGALKATIAACDASVVVGPPTVMAQLATDPPQHDVARHLRLIINGAAALPRALGARLSDATGVPVVEPWGLTEATLAVTSGPRDGAGKRGSVGLALPYCAVKAVRTDAAGTALGDCVADEIGVLAIHGPMVFEGYLGRPAHQQPFFPSGWLDTGDLGRVDGDGFVWVTGRAKELIKRGGHGIDPGMIEDALMAHAAVSLAAAVGRPDAYAGEIPVAYVQCHPGAVVDAAELIAFAQARIPERAAVPKEIMVLPALPVTPVGKVHKQALKLDLTRRVAEACARDIAGPDAPLQVDASGHPLHGIAVRLLVPRAQVAAVRSALAAFTFHAEVDALED